MAILWRQLAEVGWGGVKWSRFHVVYMDIECVEYVAASWDWGYTAIIGSALDVINSTLIYCTVSTRSTKASEAYSHDTHEVYSKYTTYGGMGMDLCTVVCPFASAAVTLIQNKM